jgi:hypothetical protein
MAFFVTGNAPINSTFAVVVSPSTTALIAELDSSNFGSSGKARTYSVNIWLGGSTGQVWVVEQVTSTSVSGTNVVDFFNPFTGSGQTSQFVRKYKVSGNDRIRVRHLSSVTGNFTASLQAEEIV